MESIRQERKWLRVFIFILLTVLLMIASGYGIYIHNQNRDLRNQLNSLQDEKSELETQATKLTEELNKVKQDKPQQTDEYLAQKAAQRYLNAQKLDTEYIAKILKIEGIFAAASASPASMPHYSPAAMYLKKVDGDWIVIWSGQNGPDKAFAERFGLPEGWWG